MDVRDLLQETLTRISRRWDDFSSQENWWSLLVLSRQFCAVNRILSVLDAPDELKQQWTILSEQALEVLAPARTIVALYVDDNSHSRGLSNRILQGIQGQLNQQICIWLKQNTLGVAMLSLGEWLYGRSSFISFNDTVQPSLQQWAAELYSDTVAHFSELDKLQAVAYLYRRLNHPAYDSLHQFINLQIVVLGMTDALEICVITEEESRAKLASWTRRLTVEQRHLAQAKDEYQMQLTFDR